MIIAKPRTIELAYETAINAKPPRSLCDRFPRGDWQEHHRKIIRILEGLLREARAR